MDHLAGGVGQAEVAALVVEGELLVVDAEQVEHGGVEVVHLHRVLDDVVLEAGGERVSLTRVDAGNPHAVSFRPVTREQFERLGPALSVATAFEAGANVEFAKLERDGLDVLVWERGAGPTLACGTGACAAVAAARAKGLIAGQGGVIVRLPGGELEVRFEGGGDIATLRGPARRTFSGQIVGSEPIEAARQGSASDAARQGSPNAGGAA